MDIIEAPKNTVELIAIQSAAIRGFGATRGAMHKALVQTLLHCAKHGDYNGAKQFLIAIKKDDAAKAIAKKVQAWLSNYGGMIVSTDRTMPELMGVIVGFKGQEFITANIETAKANPYYQRDTEAKPKEAFDINRAIDDLLKAINTAKTKPDSNLILDANHLGKLLHATTVTADLLDEALNCTALAGILSATEPTLEDQLREIEEKIAA
jgi:hypothetical protein